MSQPEKQQDLLPADPQAQTIALINVIERAAHSPDMDVEKMERLLAMHERIVAKNAEVMFNDAMNQAQSEIGRIAADAENKQTHSMYATYAALDRVLRPVYTKNGFSLSFDTAESVENTVTVLCYVSHKGGHTRTYRANIPADGKGAKGGDVMTKTHAVGSGMQYGQRYLLKLIFNVAIGVDDDGNAAGIEYITEEQAADLSALLDEVGANKQAFCTYFKIGKVEELPVKCFKQAVAMTEAKRRK